MAAADFSGLIHVASEDGVGAFQNGLEQMWRMIGVGDASERVRQQPRHLKPTFSLRFLFLLVTLVAFALLWSERSRRHEQLQSARAAVQHQIVEGHWKLWVKGLPAKSFVDQMTSEIGGTAGWSFDVIDAAPGSVNFTVKNPIDEFERQALNQIRNGATEVSHVDWGGDVRYIRAVSAAATCAHCHLRKAGPMTGRIAVVGIRRTP